MTKIFSSITNGGKQHDITSFCLGERHRKFYIGDMSGSVRVYNISSGVYMKAVGEEEQAPIIEPPEGKNAITRAKPLNLFSQALKGVKTDHTAEISGLCYIKEDHIVLTSSFDSTINVYDEEKPEETPRLRQLTHGHGTSEITCLTFNEYLSLIATGIQMVQ